MQVGRHYQQSGNTSAVDTVLSRIDSAQDREVAEAVLAATNTTIDESQIRPLFLRMVEERSNFHKKSRARQAWYVNRVRAFVNMAESGITSFSHYREQLGAAASVDSLPVGDKAIGLGLDLIARSVCTPASEPKLDSAPVALTTPVIEAEADLPESASTLLAPEHAVAELNSFFAGEKATSNGLIRSWIAYALSRSGYWTTHDVKVAWSARHRYENPEWIIGFAAGFEQSGRGETVQRLVDATQTTNARCYLRIGQLISLVSDDPKLASTPRHAMK